MMPHFVFAFIDRSESGKNDVVRILADPRVTVLDQEGARLLLVECSEDVALDLLKEFPRLRVAPEIAWRTRDQE